MTREEKCIKIIKMNNINTWISEIYPADDRFRIGYFNDLSSITASIKKIGLVHPLVLTVREEKKVIVCGWKRFFACEELAFLDVPALILDEQDDLKVFNLAVFENVSFRKFDSLEKAEIISKWQCLKVEENRIIRKLMPLLDIPPTKEYFDLFNSISGLDKEIKKGLAQNRMDLRVLAVYLELDPPARHHILPFLLTLSQNKQKKLLENLIEITRREDISTDELFVSEDVQAIISKTKLSLRQRAEKLSQYLMVRRYPLLSERMDRFETLTKKTGLRSKYIEIKASDYFEEEGITFSFSAGDIKGYNNKIKALSELAGKNELSELFKLISNEDE